MNKKDLAQIENLFEKSFERAFIRIFPPAFAQAFALAFPPAFLLAFTQVWDRHLEPVLSDIQNNVLYLQERVGNLEDKVENLRGTVSNLPTKEYMDDKMADARLAVDEKISTLKKNFLI